MELEKLSKRNSNLDIIRIVAAFTVVSVHFFLNTGFYGIIVEGPLMYFMCTFRALFNVCVPLFIILTGYLMCNKKLSKSYYGGVVKTLLIYVLSSIACIVFNALYLKKSYTLGSAVLGILDFTGAEYSWYMEMYFGLFLMIPFLNLIYNNLKSKKQKQVLVITFTVITIASSLFNIYDFSNSAWWANPQLSKEYTPIFNDYWRGVYPIAYYFVGCYLREYKLKIKTSTLAISFVASTFLFGAFNFYRCHGAGYQSSLYGYWYGFEAFISAVLLFVLLTRIKTDNFSIKVKFGLCKLSNLALGIYLLSYIFDKVCYPLLNSRVITPIDRMPFYFLMVPIVFILSAAASFLINTVADLCIKAFPKIKAFVKAQIANNRKMFWQDVFFGALMLFGLILSLWKCVYGFGGNDEAFYLTIPHRLSLGDAFISDEWHLSQLSGFLLYPFVSLYTLFVGSTEGIMLTARIIYVLLHLGVSVFVYYRLRNYGIFSAIACFLYFIYTPYNIMAYSYNTMGLDFVVLTGVLIGTSNEKNIKSIIASGVTFACAVLCCPYLIFAYVLYLICIPVYYLCRHKNWNCVFSSYMFKLKTILLFTAGAGVVALLFIIFALSRISISEVFKYLPYLMTDPEHPTILFLTRLGYYFNSIYTLTDTFKIPIISYIVLLLIMIIDRKRKSHRSLYLLGTIGIVIISYFMLFPQLTTKYFNAIMFPMFFIGLTSYILIDKKPRALFAGLFVLGIIYTVAITFTSNQYHYVICMVIATSNVASYIFLGQLIREIRAKQDNLDYAVSIKYFAFVMVAFMLCLQTGFQINAKVEHAFWESDISVMNSKISQGPAKGIYTTTDNCANYEAIYNDLSYYSTKPKDKILCLTDKTWCYLALNDFDYGTLSAWISGENDGSIERLKTYYAVNPDKVPKYIYIPKDNNFDLGNFYAEASKFGYQILETNLSYKLEKVY